MSSRRSSRSRPAWRRVVLKLSGEVLGDRSSAECLAPARLTATAEQLKRVHELGVQLAVVVGGGNIFRGLPHARGGMDRCLADQIGMLATLVNSLALQAALEQAGVPVRVMSATLMPETAELFVARRAIHHLEEGRLVIIGGGTGNPFFSTDSAAALRACELQADALLKATKVDGIYTADPQRDPNARRLPHLTYAEALERRLEVMDAAAFALCRENRIPIIVFNFFKPGELVRAICGEKVGTRVDDGPAGAWNRES